MINKINYSNEAANSYLANVAKYSDLTDHHKGYTVVPHKIFRCYKLTEYEKLILIDLSSYMGDKSYCFPSLETISRNIGCSSKTVERHMKLLEEKKFIYIAKTNRSNKYYLSSMLERNPYILLSEATHHVINNVRDKLNDPLLSKWIKEVMNSQFYNNYLDLLFKIQKVPLFQYGKDDVTENLKKYSDELLDLYKARFMKNTRK